MCQLVCAMTHAVELGAQRDATAQAAAAQMARGCACGSVAIAAAVAVQRSMSDHCGDLCAKSAMKDTADTIHQQ